MAFAGSTVSSDAWRQDVGMRLIMDNGSKWLRFGAADTQQPDPIKKIINFFGTDKKGGDHLMFEDLEGVFDESNYRYCKPHVRSS